MRSTLVTGATGLVGFNIARELLARGRAVRALVRDEQRARQRVPEGVELVGGDVTDVDSIRRALEGCDVFYHAAGLPEQWLRDPTIFERVNVGGTRNAVEAAIDAGVERFVYTSTIDVFAAGHGEELDESVIDEAAKGTDYERSKQDADRVVSAALEDGLPAVFLHPAAVYGPGPAGSPGLNKMIADLCARKVPALLPGGMPVVFSGDVGLGHVLAEAHPPGSRYILSESYYTLREIAEEVARQREGAKVPRVAPLWLARLISGTGEALAKLTRRAPLLPRGQLHFLQWGARPQSARAQRELGWKPTSLRDGIAALFDQSESAAVG